MSRHLGSRWPFRVPVCRGQGRQPGMDVVHVVSPQLPVPAPTIRVSTHLVLLDAVVTDKQGKPIPGLRPEDFEVEENGKAQKLSTFVGAGENLVAALGPAA